MTKPFVVGVSACWMHADKSRQRFNGRTLLFIEQSMAELLLGHGQIIPFLIPWGRTGFASAMGAGEVVAALDGLVLQGGVDVAPPSYGEEPLRREWSGDKIRDDYEIELVEACLQQDRPILGICRGHQLLNVALGGTLVQDIPTQVDTAIVHRCADKYHRVTHEVAVESGSTLGQIYGVSSGRINSVHHQAIKDLGDGLRVEARCPQDGIVEAVKLESDGLYARGVQWHPEFQEPDQKELLSPRPLVEDFTAAMAKRRR